MDSFVVQGGRQLTGEVSVSGSKNAALPIMAASLLSTGTTTLHRVPHLVDVNTLSRLLHELGVRATWCGQSLSLHVEREENNCAPYEHVSRMRASICVLGPLLAKRGNAVVALPGGCNIGHRPIDLHLKGLSALGAEIDVRHGYVFAKAEKLRGTQIYLGGPFGSTVTGTCNVMSAATLAQGATTIESAACEPEVVALGEFLISMGAKIGGLGTPKIEIEGVDELTPTTWTIPPDRIEAASLMMAVAATRGRVTFANLDIDHLTAVVDLLNQMGVNVVARSQSELIIDSTQRLRSVDVASRPYPGLPTDIQAQVMALMSIASDTSTIRDFVFPDRFMHVAELERLGARIRQNGDTAFVAGVPKLSGAHVTATDLRASAALVIAGLVAEGETIIHGIEHLDRGYERFEYKLNQLGASVQRVVSQPEKRAA